MSKTRDSEVDSVFVDESGYTGADLLNAAQRVHAVAAVRCSTLRAQEIVDRYFGSVKASELKLSKLIRRKTYRKALIAAMLDLTQDQGAVGSIYCKRYALWLHLLDDCIEPAHHRRGIPFYENGWNRSFASLLFKTAPAFWTPEHTNAILATYQVAARSKSSDDVNAFIISLQNIRGRELAEYFEPAMDGAAEVISSIMDERGTLDLSHPMALGIISWLEERTSSPYQIVHDNNRAIGQALEALQALADIDLEREFRVSSITTASFPLKFTETVLADSQSDLRLQLADLLAGSVRLCSEMLLGFKHNDGLPDELLARLPEEAFLFNIASPDFHDTHATFGDGQGASMIDFIAQEMAKRGVGQKPCDS